MFGFLRRPKPLRVPPATSAASAKVERRAHERTPTYADALAVSEGGGTQKRGIVLDLTDHGARLRLEYSDGLLDGMIIKIARYGVTRPAIVRWRTRMDVGVEFAA